MVNCCQARAQSSLSCCPRQYLLVREALATRGRRAFCLGNTLIKLRFDLSAEVIAGLPTNAFKSTADSLNSNETVNFPFAYLKSETRERKKEGLVTGF